MHRIAEDVCALIGDDSLDKKYKIQVCVQDDDHDPDNGIEGEGWCYAEDKGGDKLAKYHNSYSP